MKRMDNLLASLICLLFILTCLLTFSGCQDKSSAENLSTTVFDAQTLSNRANNSDSSDNKNSAVFYSDGGAVLGKYDVPKGGTPDTPVQGLNKEGYVFTGWSVKPGSNVTDNTTSRNTQDNDHTLPQIDKNVDFEANYIDIKNKSNVFAFPAVYGKCGETIETKLQLCGKVNLCAFDIQVIYDSAILELTSINSDLDLDVVVSHDEANHIIKFNYAAAKNRTRTAEIMKLRFKVLSAGKAKTLIQLKATEIVAIDENQDNLPIPAPFTLIDGVVYIK